MKRFKQDFRTTLVITYKKYHWYGTNSWYYTTEEYRTEIDRFWTMQDAFRVFRKVYSDMYIVSIRHEYEYINRSLNHHSKTIDWDILCS